MCCSKAYPELKDKPCDLDHYCNYIDWVEYARIQVIGIIITILTGVISVAIVVVRDVMMLFTPKNRIAPVRQLTTMSAAFAPEAMPAVSSVPAE